MSCSQSRSSPRIIIDDETRSRLITSLGSWHFEPHKLPEEEVLACTYILFEALFLIKGMHADIGVSLRESCDLLKVGQRGVLTYHGCSQRKYRHSCSTFVNSIVDEIATTTSNMRSTSFKRHISFCLQRGSYLLYRSCCIQTHVCGNPISAPQPRRGLSSTVWITKTCSHCT